MLRSKLGSSFENAVKTAMELVHPLDAKQVLERMGLAAERQLLKETAMKFVQEDVDSLLELREQKSKLETAYKLFKKGVELSVISDATKSLQENKWKAVVS